MKMIVAVIHKDDAPDICQALRDHEYMFTKLSSKGGFTKQGNCTLLIGVEDALVEPVLREIKARCATREVEIPLIPFGDAEYFDPDPVRKVTAGGATIFVLDVEHFEKV